MGNWQLGSHLWVSWGDSVCMNGKPMRFQRMRKPRLAQGYQKPSPPSSWESQWNLKKKNLFSLYCAIEQIFLTNCSYCRFFRIQYLTTWKEVQCFLLYFLESVDKNHQNCIQWTLNIKFCQDDKINIDNGKIRRNFLQFMASVCFLNFHYIAPLTRKYRPVQ